MEFSYENLHKDPHKQQGNPRNRPNRGRNKVDRRSQVAFVGGFPALFGLTPSSIAPPLAGLFLSV